jgi:hypothetical protein
MLSLSIVFINLILLCTNTDFEFCEVTQELLKSWQYLSYYQFSHNWTQKFRKVLNLYLFIN